MSAKPMTAQYWHSPGFGDDTIYLETDGEGVWIMRRDGTRKLSRYYTPDMCEELVKSGAWIKKEIAATQGPLAVPFDVSETTGSEISEATFPPAPLGTPVCDQPKSRRGGRAEF